MAGLDKYTKMLLHFDESVTKDECGNTWTTSKLIGYGSPSNPTLTESNAKFGKAILFDGTYRMIMTDRTMSFGANDFTLDFWTCMDSKAKAWGHIFEFSNSTVYNSRKVIL